MHCDEQIAGARSAYKAARSAPPWDQANCASQLARCLHQRGRLQEAQELAVSAWTHAQDGQRMAEGMPTVEIMEGYDAAAMARVVVQASLAGAAGVRCALDDLVTVHTRAREKLAEFNRHAVLPVDGPTGAVDPELQCGGEPAATLALLEGRPTDALRIIDRVLLRIGEKCPGSRHHLTIRMLRLEAAEQDPSPWTEEAELESIQAVIDEHDVRWCACRLALVRARLAARIGHSADGLVHLDRALDIAASWGLGEQWLELMTCRVELLEMLGGTDEACATARALLLGEPSEYEFWTGPGDAPVALEQLHRHGIAEAGSLLAAAGESTPELESAITEVQNAPPPRSLVPKRRAVAIDPDHVPTSEELHERALRVLRSRQEHGTPFVLYLRKFHIDVSHTASPFGPELLENALLEALPESIEVITIQDRQSFLHHTASAVSLRRRAPALALDDDGWEDVAEALIHDADLIVSECPMLSDGVRTELERAHRLSRHDSTILVLPPQLGPFATLDNDPLVQMFPLCLWADNLHTTPLHEIPVVRALLDRMEALAVLPPARLREIASPEARAEFEPVDRAALAEILGDEARRMLTFASDDSRTPYYAFWTLFRASALQAKLLAEGSASSNLRLSYAMNQLELSAALTDYERRDGKIWLKGDVDAGFAFAHSAHQIFASLGTNIAGLLAETAEERVQEYRRLQRAIDASPDDFVLEPVYGPLVGLWAPDRG